MRQIFIFYFMTMITPPPKPLPLNEVSCLDHSRSLCSIFYHIIIYVQIIYILFNHYYSSPHQSLLRLLICVQVMVSRLSSEAVIGRFIHVHTILYVSSSNIFITIDVTLQLFSLIYFSFSLFIVVCMYIHLDIHMKNKIWSMSSQ